jgi:cytochrome d ubiquinol oxidase subunit II
VQGLPVGPDGVYAGKGALDSLTPFAALCGLGLCLGDVLLGAAWLVLKSEGELRERCYRILPALLFGVLAFLAAAFVASIGIDLRVMHRWIDRPWLVVFPLIGLAAVFAMRHGIRRRLDAWPFASAAAIFLAAFATLAASFLPYMVPYSITIAEAAAPRSSLAFIFWGAGAFVLPLMLVYTITAYSVFNGKARPDGEYH